MYEDPTAEAVRFDSTNYNYFGRPTVPSYLADMQKSMGNLRQSANTRPTPSPAFYPPERETEVPTEKCDYNWTWPEREKRPPPPRLKRCAARRRRGHPPPSPAPRPPRSPARSLVTFGSSHASQAGGTRRAELLAGVRSAPTLARVLSTHTHTLSGPQWPASALRQLSGWRVLSALTFSSVLRFHPPLGTKRERE